MAWDSFGIGLDTMGENALRKRRGRNGVQGPHFQSKETNDLRLTVIENFKVVVGEIGDGLDGTVAGDHLDLDHANVNADRYRL